MPQVWFALLKTTTMIIRLRERTVENQIDRESPSPVPTELVLSDDEDDDERHLTEEKSESPKGTLKVRDRVSAGYYYDNERLI